MWVAGDHRIRLQFNQGWQSHPSENKTQHPKGAAEYSLICIQEVKNAYFNLFYFGLKDYLTSENSYTGDLQHSQTLASS